LKTMDLCVTSDQRKFGIVDKQTGFPNPRILRSGHGRNVLSGNIPGIWELPG
jgi:hypothetical protein